MNEREINQEDAAVRIVAEAQNRNKINEAINTFENYSLSEEEADNIKKRSTRVGKTEAKRSGAKKNVPLFLASSALVIVLLKAGVSEAKGLINKINFNLKYNEGIEYYTNEAKNRLVEEGLATRKDDGSITVLDNNPEDYSVLGLSTASLLEQHIYCEALGETEFNDAIKTASYENGAYHYTGSAQWRTINGYIDINKNNAPSHMEQIVYFGDKVVDAYENNQKYTICSI